MAAGLFCSLAVTLAQTPPQTDSTSAADTQGGLPGMEMHDHRPMSGGMSSTFAFFMDESSGTGVQPSASPMPMVMTDVGEWHLMWMGQAFLVDTQQTGPLGYDKLYSTNWGMLSSMHHLGGGGVLLRAMLSLEPATITERRYPLLFQTGGDGVRQPYH